MEAAGAKLLLAGSYSSLLARALKEPYPPAISTFPLDSKVAVAPVRASFIEGVEAAKLLATGSYSSTLLRGKGTGKGIVYPDPPAISTLPLGNKVAVAPKRATFDGVDVEKLFTGGVAANPIPGLIAAKGSSNWAGAIPLVARALPGPPKTKAPVTS